MSDQSSGGRKGPRPRRCCWVAGTLAMLAAVTWYAVSDASAGHDSASRLALGAAYALTAAGLGMLVGLGWSGFHLGWHPVATKAGPRH